MLSFKVLWQNTSSRIQFKLEINQTQTQVLENRPLIFYIMDISEKSHFPLFCFEEPFKHFSSTRVASLFTWISHRGSTQARHPAGRSAVCLCCLRRLVACVTSRVTLRLRRKSAYNRIHWSIISYSLHITSFLWFSLHTVFIEDSWSSTIFGRFWLAYSRGWMSKKGAKNWQDKRIF